MSASVGGLHPDDRRGPSDALGLGLGARHRPCAKHRTRRSERVETLLYRRRLQQNPGHGVMLFLLRWQPSFDVRETSLRHRAAAVPRLPAGAGRGRGVRGCGRREPLAWRAAARSDARRRGRASRAMSLSVSKARPSSVVSRTAIRTFSRLGYVCHGTGDEVARADEAAPPGRPDLFGRHVPAPDRVSSAPRR